MLDYQSMSHCARFRLRLTCLLRENNPDRLFPSVRSFLSLLAISLILIEYCFGQQVNPDRKVIQDLTDIELIEQISSAEWQQATAAVEEIVKRGERMIPLLLKKKGDKQYFRGYLSNNKMSATAITIPSGNRRNDEQLSKEGQFVTVEVAALYLITAIYYDSLSIAQGPYLTDLSLADEKRRMANTPKLIKRSWKSVDRWTLELNKQGMAALRAKKYAPLDDAEVRFW